VYIMSAMLQRGVGLFWVDWFRELGAVAAQGGGYTQTRVRGIVFQAHRSRFVAVYSKEIVLLAIGLSQYGHQRVWRSVHGRVGGRADCAAGWACRAHT